MAETFPNFKPIYGSRKTINTKTKVVSLGDGYQHRSLFGLPQNQSPMVLDLTFSVSEAESDIIFSFLTDRDLDQKAFSYQPTDEAAALNFICTKKLKTIPTLNRAIINLTFLQVFEP
tara:strand:+ start:41 stop:391 length:351 start_codon:yes stop_codon:yes gene_type:complete